MGGIGVRAQQGQQNQQPQGLGQPGCVAMAECAPEGHGWAGQGRIGLPCGKERCSLKEDEVFPVEGVPAAG